MSPTTPNRPDLDRRGPSPAGFSLVEVVIATLVLMLLVLGLLPLFARSVLSNASGADSTQISNFSKSQAESLMQAPFNSLPVTVPGGTTEVVTTEYWDDENERFTTTAPADGSQPRWTRITRIRQYSVGDLDDGVLDEPKDGNTIPDLVHLKELEVELISNPNLYGGGRRILVTTLKSY